MIGFLVRVLKMPSPPSAWKCRVIFGVCYKRRVIFVRFLFYAYLSKSKDAQFIGRKTFWSPWPLKGYLSKTENLPYGRTGIEVFSHSQMRVRRLIYPWLLTGSEAYLHKRKGKSVTLVFVRGNNKGVDKIILQTLLLKFTPKINK